jgi:hypothetical protein
MHDVGFTPRTTSLAAMPTERRRVLQASLRFGWRARPVRLLMLVSLFNGTFLMCWQPYLLELLGRNAVWVTGVVAGLTALATIAGNALVEFFTRFCGRRTSLLTTSVVVMVVAAAGVGLVGSFWAAVALLLVASGAAGVGAPVQQAYLHEVVPSSERATVVSSVSLVSSAGGIGGQLGLGWIARAQSVPAGYVTGGLAMLLAVPPLLLLRHMRQRADVIVGRRARGPARALQGSGSQAGCGPARGRPARLSRPRSGSRVRPGAVPADQLDRRHPVSSCLPFSVNYTWPEPARVDLRGRAMGRARDHRRPCSHTSTSERGIPGARRLRALSQSRQGW